MRYAHKGREVVVKEEIANNLYSVFVYQKGIDKRILTVSAKSQEQARDEIIKAIDEERI